METNNMLNKHDAIESINGKYTNLNARIINAEKNSLLIAIPIGLIAGIIAYCTASIFPVMYSLVIGIGAAIITAVLLFHFKFGRHLPKPVMYYGEDSLFSPSSYEPIHDITIEAYNIANGNPPVDFIMPKRDD